MTDDRPLPRVAQGRLMMALCGAGFAGALYLLLNGMDADPSASLVALLAGLVMAALSTMTLLPILRAASAFGAGLAHGVMGFVLVRISGSGGVSELMWLDAAPMLLWAFLLVAVLPLPFICAGQQRAWLSYRALFEASWRILLIWAMGLLFAGLGWGLILGAGELLAQVGLPVLQDLLEEGLLVTVLSGMMLGLGGAVAAELRLRHPGRPMSRLLRLLAPPFLLVLGAFLVALALRGFEGAGLSLTLLCSWAVLVAASLITAILGPDDAEAAAPGLLPLVARALVVLMVPMAAVALWAIWIRVAQHGFTPQRVGALTLALVAGGYALSYGAGLIWRSGRGWMGQLRRANVAMALLCLGLGVLWLSRLISPEAIATQSQIARHANGGLPLEEIGLRKMATGWGAAGQAGLEELRALHADDPITLAEIDLLTGPTRPAGLNSLPPPVQQPGLLPPEEAALRQHEAQIGLLRRQLQVLPAGHPGATGFLDGMSSGPETQQRVLDGCAARTPGQHPACVAVFGDFDQSVPGEEVILLIGGAEATMMGWTRSLDGRRWSTTGMIWNSYDIDIESAIDLLHDKGVVLRPSPMQLLDLGGGTASLRPTE